jgi:acyl-homoserine-lactone acylase
MRSTHNIFLSLFVLFVLGACDSRTEEEKRWQNRVDNVTIYRDDFGVPHIYGKSDADAVFGLLYAQCEDDFKRVERNYISAIGRLAEVEGESQLYSDVRANLFMTQAEAIKEYESVPEWLQTLCVAFADGVNYYIKTHPEVKPALLTRFEPWMAMYFTEGSIGGDIESVSIKGIQAFYEADSSVVFVEDKFSMKEPQGSNGFAISGSLTQSGKAMLWINPHTSFYFRGEVHVVSEEGLNAYGGVTWGQFFVYQGFNEKNGWMHTSSYTDVSDEFKETISKQDGKLVYKYGEEWREVKQQQVVVKYKSEADSILEKTFTVYRTHHGPITKLVDGQWTSTAMMWSPAKALEQSYSRTKTSSYDEFKKVMGIRTNSSNSTVYADADGTIAFFHGNFIPKRDVQFDYSKPVDGNNPATDWKGLHNVDESIHIKNPKNGWIQNCNSTPFTAAADYSPKKEDYPNYMAGPPENFRAVHAIQVLTGRKDYTIDKLIETGYDPYLPAFEKMIPGLVEAFDKVDQKKYAGLKPAIEVLRAWDMKTSRHSVGMTLAHYYATMYGQEGPRPEEMSPMERFNYFGTGTSLEERLLIFSKAVEKLNTDFGTWNIAWGEVNRMQRLDGEVKQTFDDSKPSIPIGLAPGNWGALAVFAARVPQTTKRIYGNFGNSFVAAVEFGEKVKAKSILAGGQSGDPTSPHFFDQAQRYADAQFKDVAFYKDDVEKSAKRKYKPGEK